jgi:sorbitol-6-phosphate 2-dehydrogenase
MDIRFDGQTIIVTGSASGIGQGIAREFAASGGNVVIADLNYAGAQKTAAELVKDHGVQALPVETDVTRKASTQALAAKVMERFGRIDVLVNNAGITYAAPLADFPEEKWDLTLSINLKGYFLVGQAIVPHMIAARRGAIVNISSKTGLKGSADNSAYSASKGGIIIMTQGWARELARHQIRANSICPGNVLYGSGSWSDDLKKAYATKLGIPVDQVEKYYIDQVPLKRPCSVQDVAHLAVFLASDKASYITGCAYLVDGGQECR